MIKDFRIVLDDELAKWDARRPLKIEQRSQVRHLKKMIKHHRLYMLGEQLDDRYDTEGNER